MLEINLGKVSRKVSLYIDDLPSYGVECQNQVLTIQPNSWRKEITL